MKARICATLAILTGGCNDGVQRGKYVVGSSSEIHVYKSGSLLTLGGYEPNFNTTPRPLLYALALNMSANSPPECRTSDQSRDSTIEWTWKGSASEQQIALNWDRARDVVQVGKATFDRSAGNAFVLIHADGKAIDVTQVAVKDSKSAADAVRQIETSLAPESAARKALRAKEE